MFVGFLLVTWVTSLVQFYLVHELVLGVTGIKNICGCWFWMPHFRDVSDSNFPNPAWAGSGGIYELKSGWAWAAWSRIWESTYNNTRARMSQTSHSTFNVNPNGTCPRDGYWSV